MERTMNTLEGRKNENITYFISIYVPRIGGFSDGHEKLITFSLDVADRILVIGTIESTL